MGSFYTFEQFIKITMFSLNKITMASQFIKQLIYQTNFPFPLYEIPWDARLYKVTRKHNNILQVRTLPTRDTVIEFSPLHPFRPMPLFLQLLEA